MGAARINPQANQPKNLQPRDRIVNIWSASENGVAQTDIVMSGFLVTTRELAEQCEILGAEYVYINPANTLAFNVENRPLPPMPPAELSLVPTAEEEAEDVAASEDQEPIDGDGPPESNEE